MQNVIFNLPQKTTANQISEKIQDLQNYSVGMSIVNLEVEKVDNSSTISTTLKLPYDFRNGTAVFYNNELHLIGCKDYPTRHYKWDGSVWTSVESLPYEISGCSATILDNILYLDDGRSMFCKWDGVSWEQLKIPGGDYHGNVICFNGRLYSLGGIEFDDTEKHYWVYTVSKDYWAVHTDKLPYAMRGACFVVLGNEIYAIGGDETVNSKYSKYFYKATTISNASSWTQLPQLPVTERLSAVVYNNEIHILGGYQRDGTDCSHYKFNGTAWVKLNNTPYYLDEYGTAVVYNNDLYILGGDFGYSKNFYKYDEDNWSNTIKQTVTKIKYIFKYYLYKGAQIICDKTKLFKDATSNVNITEIDNGYIVESTGSVALSTIENPTEKDKLHSIIYKTN